MMQGYLLEIDGGSSVSISSNNVKIFEIASYYIYGTPLRQLPHWLRVVAFYASTCAKKALNR